MYYHNGEEIEVPITVAKASKMDSGVIQCTFLDKLTRTVWVQRLTQVAIIGLFDCVSVCVRYKF